MPTKDVTTPVTRLTWYMDAHSWSHWARGRGTTTIQQVLLNGIHAVLEILNVPRAFAGAHWKRSIARKISLALC